MFYKPWFRVCLIAVVLVLMGLAFQTQGQIVQQAQQILPAQINWPGSAGQTQSPFVLTGTSGGAAAITITQPATPGKTNWVTGITVTGGGATGASVITATLKSGATVIANFDIAVPAGATLGIVQVTMPFPQPIPGLGPGQTMVLTVPSFGAGNTASSANLIGFVQ